MIMKTRGLQDLFLPPRWAVHARMLLFCALFTPLWGLIIGQRQTLFFLVATFSMMFVEIEILYALSRKLFSFSRNMSRSRLTIEYLARLALFLVLAILTCMLLYTMVYIGVHIFRGIPLVFPEMLPNLLWVAKLTGLGLLFSVPIFFFTSWQESLKREYELREQNLLFQNQTLKNQVNPHFLFNSLNTLSALVETQAEVAGLFISRLSSIYRYILENAPRDKVPLKEELAFLGDYFFLHQVRDDRKIQLSVAVEHPEDFEILPVSLQILLENAVKHNMATRDQPLRIRVFTEGAYIVVCNNIQRMATQLPSTRTGLANLRERVRLATGKPLIVEETEQQFIVKIPLIS